MADSPAGRADTVVSGRASHARGICRPPPATARQTRPARFAIPDPLSLEQARKLVRDLYQKEYESRKDAQQQRAVAQRMLKQADEMKDDPAGQYVLLEVALKIATRVGDTSTAITAVEQLVENFKVNDLEMTHETLVALAKKDRDHASSSQVLAKARGLIEQAIREEQFETADSLCQIASAAARQLGDRDAASQLIQQAAFVVECQKAFKDVQRILMSAKDAEDPEGNLRVGQYYCLMRGEWDKGLPLLAKGSHTRLRELAEAEMAHPTIPADQLELADGWWELGTSDAAHQAALYRRAAFWYHARVTGAAHRLVACQGRNATQGVPPPLRSRRHGVPGRIQSTFHQPGVGVARHVTPLTNDQGPPFSGMNGGPGHVFHSSRGASFYTVTGLIEQDGIESEHQLAGVRPVIKGLAEASPSYQSYRTSGRSMRFVRGFQFRPRTTNRSHPCTAHC